MEYYIEKEWNIAIGKTTYESHRYNDNQKESDIKKFILNNFNVYKTQEQVKLIYGVGL